MRTQVPGLSVATGVSLSLPQAEAQQPLVEAAGCVSQQPVFPDGAGLLLSQQARVGEGLSGVSQQDAVAGTAAGLSQHPADSLLASATLPGHAGALPQFPAPVGASPAQQEVALSSRSDALQHAPLEEEGDCMAQLSDDPPAIRYSCP